MQDSVIGIKATVDGITVEDLDKYRIQSPLFSFALPKNNILWLPANITTQSASDGNWVFLKPLPIDKHVIYFKGSLRNISSAANNNSNNNNSANFAFAGPYGWDYPITYHITVTNSSSSSSTIQALLLIKENPNNNSHLIELPDISSWLSMCSKDGSSKGSFNMC